jgi:hypothetical protein
LFQSLTLPGSNDGVTVQGPLSTGTFGTEITIGSILSRALTYVFFLAGLILLFMLIAGGFQMMTAAGDPEQLKAGQSKAVSALIGFIIIFIAYWAMQLVQTVLGFQILS